MTVSHGTPIGIDSITFIRFAERDMPRPRFSAAWAAAMRIYAPINSAEKVARTIGGNVATNIQRWRKADVIKFPPSLERSTVDDRQGIVLFEVSASPIA
ncbi:hypothetical protein [Burkholderia sola]|uniref:hypothetical protein n=1 Tax=Burkholderia sola TaxID=2843302 RepID=UPI0023DDEE6B|nr:hypothetical protein [Burkholderia sola]MDF3081765.1 hypothetical protein [Burkholderia sola]